MMKSYKILKSQHLTVNVDRKPGLIHAIGFITHISWFSLGILVGGLVNKKKCCIFEKLKITILAGDSVLA